MIFRLIFILFLTLTQNIVSAQILLEPFLGYIPLGSSKVADDKVSLRGPNLGLLVGYEEIIMAGIGYETSSINLKLKNAGQPDALDERSKYGGRYFSLFVGIDLALFVRFHLSYYPVIQYKDKDGSYAESKFKGKGMGGCLGLGILPFDFYLNIHFRILDFSRYYDSRLNDNFDVIPPRRGHEVILSLSRPLLF